MPWGGAELADVEEGFVLRLGGCVAWWNSLEILGQQQCSKDSEIPTHCGSRRRGTAGELELEQNGAWNEAWASGG